MYMFNLLFNPNRKDGLFEDPPNPPNVGPNAGLLNSKHWLRSNVPSPPNPPAVFNYENPPGGWRDLGQAKTLLIRPAPVFESLLVRIAPVPSAGAPFVPNATAELVAAFGRPVFQEQGFASPFEKGGPPTAFPQRAETSFLRTVPARPAGGGWVFDFGVMNRPGPPPGADFTHRFGFALGVNITDPTAGGVILSFGEDPEFDVGG